MTQDREELKRHEAGVWLHGVLDDSRGDSLSRPAFLQIQYRVASLLSDLGAMQEALRRAGVDLAEARDMVTSWGAYADPYIQEKHGLENDIAGLSIAIIEARQALSKEPEA